MTNTAPLVLVGDIGPVRVVSINRPEVRNALDIPTRVELAEELERAASDDGVRAIVLTGEGPAFCSGGDVATMERQPRELTVPRAEAAQRVIRAIWAAPKPVIAAVEGAAYGAGMSLALSCDRVVAAEDARFAATFARVGLAGDMGIFASLPARVGLARARQLLMFPDPVSGEPALAMGLVDRLVEPGEARAAALADATRLAAMAPAALATVKQFFAGIPRDPRAVLGLEVDRQADLFDTDDFAEGVAAFKEGRQPRFGPG